MEYKEKKEEVKKYFKNNELVMISMNDYASTSIIGRNILSYLEQQIKDGLKVDASFLTLNKAEHINLMLEYNLTIEEIKLAQALSIYDGIEHLLEEREITKHTDFLLDTTDSILKKMFKPNEIDKYIGISDLIRSTKTPIVIHSTGSNDLMRILGTNPYVIDKTYSERKVKATYKEAKEKARDPKTIRIIMDDIDKNFHNILSLNPNTMLVSLGLYIPEILKQRKYQSFRKLILNYNRALRELCSSYSAMYINTDSIKNRTPKTLSDFNLSKSGQKKLAKAIVEELYTYLTRFEITNLDLEEDITYRKEEDLTSYYIDKLTKINSDDISNERKVEQAVEAVREKRILEKVLKMRKNQ